MNKKLSRFLQGHVFYEVTAAIGIISAFCLVLNHINNTDWKDFVFANSDLLTLPLLWNSITSSEPFHWVFSSQIFLFPEFPLYALSSLFSSDFRSILLINAFFAIVIFYILLRAIASTVSKSRIINISFALLVAIILLGCIAIEQRPAPSIAINFFVTTSYYGVILSALFVLYATLAGLKSKSTKTKRMLIGSSFVISLLTGVSNPLFFLQFSAPLLVSITLLTALKVVGRKPALQIILIQLGAVGLSIAIRKTVLSQYFSPLGDVSNYLHTENIVTAIHVYIGMIQQMLAGGLKEKLAITILGLLLLSSLILLVRILYRTFRKKGGGLVSGSISNAILISVGCIAPMATFFGSIVTGNALVRYLLPLLFILPIAFIPLYYTITKKYEHAVKLGIIILVITVTLMALVKNPVQDISDLKNYRHTGAACLDAQLSGTPYKAGVAQYWRARVLQLNSQDGHIVEQTDGSLKRFGWLYNNATYDLHNLSFVVVDKPELTVSSDITTEGGIPILASSVLYALGQPNNIYNCEDFDIYTYDNASYGSKILNRTVRDKTMGM